MNIGTLTTGADVVTNLSTNYLPMYLQYTAATQLTGLKVSVLGKGTIVDLDAAGLNSVGIIKFIGRKTNTYIIPLATGFFPATNVSYSFTNSAAQTPDIFVSSRRRAIEGRDFFCISSMQQALAKSGATLVNFITANFPNAAAADLFNITYRDDHQENNITRDELQALQQYKQYVSNTAGDYMLLNDDQMIKAISIIPAATQFVYSTALVSPNAKFMVGNPLQ